MSRSEIPPDEVERKLLKVLSRRYAELEEDKKVFRSISYEPTSSALYKALVQYHSDQSSADAVFNYVEERSGNSYRWYCVRDWKD